MALDGATVQPPWDERVRRVPFELLGYYPALAKVTFPVAPEGAEYAVAVLPRDEAERATMGLLEGIRWAVGPDFGALALEVLGRLRVASPDPQLAVAIHGKPGSDGPLDLRTVVSLSTGAVLYAAQPFQGLVEAPYVRVAGVVFDPPNRVWAVIPRGLFAWALPGGHLDPGESPREAVVREMREEAGLDVVPRRLLGRIYRPWSTTLVFLCRQVGEARAPSTADEIDGAAAVRLEDLAADERLWLERIGAGPLDDAREAEFDPARHPRGEGGKFAPSGVEAPGAEEPAAEVRPAQPMDHAAMQARLVELADHFGYPSRLCEVGESDAKFEVAGRQYNEAGHAELKTGRIVMRPLAFAGSPTNLEGQFAHEVEHQKWEAVKNKAKEERAQAFQEEKDAHDKHGNLAYRREDATFILPGGETRVEKALPPEERSPLNAAGFLTEEGERRFPHYALTQKYTEGPGLERLEKDDGFTEYTRSWWASGKLASAIHETLADIARVQQTSASWKGDGTPPRFAGHFYRDVNRMYARLQRQQAKAREAEPGPAADGDALVVYLDDRFRPVAPDQAAMVKAIYADRVVFGFPEAAA
jgi:ADP-ribose pyrophosphatase YjhB (NUDIX family)